MFVEWGGTDFVRIKRGRSKGEADFIKIKRKQIPDDVIPIRIEGKAGFYAVDDDKDDYRKNEDVDENDETTNEDDDDHDATDEDDDNNDEDDQENDDDDAEDEDVFDNKKRETRSFTHGFHLAEGKMKHGMEDFLVAKRKKMNGHKLGLYAIFDGHSGRPVAEYLRDHLFDDILLQPDFWKDPISSVKRAYKETDEHILENVVGSRGGSTAVTAILVDGRKLVVANVGDSHAVLCRNGIPKQIAVDHDPKREKGLVESKGGFVSKKPGNVPRVDGQLSMTRAFGDGRLKDHITAEPDVFIEEIDDDVEFIILASDGLWKVMSNQEVSDCIKGLKDDREAAKELVEAARQRGSQDDISSVVVMLE